MLVIFNVTGIELRPPGLEVVRMMVFEPGEAKSAADSSRSISILITNVAVVLTPSILTKESVTKLPPDIFKVVDPLPAIIAPGVTRRICGIGLLMVNVRETEGAA